MKTYRILWQILCCVLAVIGLGAAFVWAPLAILVIFGSAAVVAGAATWAIRLDRRHPPATRVDEARLAAANAFLGGTGAVAIVGCGALLGAWTFVLTLLIAGGSPYAVGFYLRIALRLRWITLPTPPDMTVRERLQAHDPAPPAAGFSTPRSMDDTELCQAWRASFAALQSAPSISVRLRIVEARRNYLDEFARRNPHGLTAWLASGARAAGNPRKFLVGSSGVGRSTIDWDSLIHGIDG